MPPQKEPDVFNPALLQYISEARFRDYLNHNQGDLDAAHNLYQWNTRITAAMWETIGHFEVALRNIFSDRLAERHHRKGRPASWLDDPEHELRDKAKKEIVQARKRVRNNNKQASDGQTVSELSFGFWRFLLSKHYTTTLWPDLGSIFAHAPNRNRLTVEEPVKRIHYFRNRLAHHQRVWTEPIADRWADIQLILNYIDPVLATWVTHHSRIDSTLQQAPIDLAQTVAVFHRKQPDK